jgi:hypothetical protein
MEKSAATMQQGNEAQDPSAPAPITSVHTFDLFDFRLEDVLGCGASSEAYKVTNRAGHTFALKLSKVVTKLLLKGSQVRRWFHQQQLKFRLREL